MEANANVKPAEKMEESITIDSDDDVPEAASKAAVEVKEKAVEKPKSPTKTIVKPDSTAKKESKEPEDDDDDVILIEDEEVNVLETDRTITNPSPTKPAATEPDIEMKTENPEHKLEPKVEETHQKMDDDSDIEEILELNALGEIPAKAEEIVAQPTKMEVDFEAEIEQTMKRGVNQLKNVLKYSNVECINLECEKTTNLTSIAPNFVLHYYSIPKKAKVQKVCNNCFDKSVTDYGTFCGQLSQQQPLLFCDLPKHSELVEISDSSDEEGDKQLVTKKEDKPLPRAIIATVEEELNDIIAETFEKINIEQQLAWTKSIMLQKISSNAEVSKTILEDLNRLQKDVDQIHFQLYSKTKPKYNELPSCNIFHDVDKQPAQSVAMPVIPTPNKAEFSRPPIVIGQFYYAVKQKLLGNWAECHVFESVSMGDKTYYKLNFVGSVAATSTTRVVPAKQMAYRHSFTVKLPLGTRVIARFDVVKTTCDRSNIDRSKLSFFPGIIAEPFGNYNKQRYLVFFDDGYAQYVQHTDVRVVCEESKEVWEDIHQHSKEFIKNYLLNFRSQRPMVQVKIGQRMITECKGKWIYAKVTNIDASLVQLYFQDDNRYEWIYRGSTRLGPLYHEKSLNVNKQNKFSKFQKRNEPSIEYITIDDDDDTQASEKVPTPTKPTLGQQQQQSTPLQQIQPADTNIRAVAKKSTVSRLPPPPEQQQQPKQSAVFMNSSTIYCEDDRPKGKVVYYTAKKHMPPQKFKPHKCSPGCLFAITHNLKSYSPLAKPLLSGWERQLCKTKTKKVFIMYRGPCGRRLRNMAELHSFLRMTKASLNVDNFDFDLMIHCLAEYVIENHIYHNPDLSDGRESMAIPCVNYFDDTQPPPCIYSTERIPTEGVNLNLDTDFLCGCDCEDDCMDKARCQCWRLTMAGAKFGNPNTEIDNIGYVYKRLQEPVLTGIYECNARCKCKKNCLNRVVQHPLQTKLQVFKTNNRGWGIRCLNDVPKGSFICIYSGHLLTEEAGNEICLINENKTGDEYFADLDYIETVEQLKEGYETDAIESESENDSDGPDYDARRDSDISDEEFKMSCRNTTSTAVRTRSQARRDSNTKKPETRNSPIDSVEPGKQTTEGDSGRLKRKGDDSITISDDEEAVREPVNLEPNLEMDKEDVPNPSSKFRSVRKLFGKHEKVFIMDAKKSGNLGRYFNHSCAPNLFVQNVFVDTHDLRFPWVAFFALSHIRAGSELTWNYNYDVGSVPGKVLYCQCGAESCRQRLL